MTTEPAWRLSDALRTPQTYPHSQTGVETPTGPGNGELPEADLRRRIGTSAAFIERGHNTTPHTAAALRDIVTHLASLEQAHADMAARLAELEQQQARGEGDGR